MIQVYRFLGVDCHCYVSSYDTVTIYHLRDLAGPGRTRIKCKDIKHINIPQFEGLTIETILDFAKNYPKAMKALPKDEKEREKLPRQYLANVVYTIVGQPFYAWVEQGVQARKRQDCQ